MLKAREIRLSIKRFDISNQGIYIKDKIEEAVKLKAFNILNRYQFKISTVRHPRENNEQIKLSKYFLKVSILNQCERKNERTNVIENSCE